MTDIDLNNNPFSNLNTFLLEGKGSRLNRDLHIQVRTLAFAFRAARSPDELFACLRFQHLNNGLDLFPYLHGKFFAEYVIPHAELDNDKFDDLREHAYSFLLSLYSRCMANSLLNT